MYSQVNNFDRYYVANSFCHNRPVAIFGRPLVAHERHCLFLGHGCGIPNGDLGLLGRQMGAEDRTEFSHVAAARSIAPRLRITKLTHVPIANACFLQRLRQHALGETWAAGLGQLTHIKQQGYSGALQCRNEIHDVGPLISQRVNLVQFCLLGKLATVIITSALSENQPKFHRSSAALRAISNSAVRLTSKVLKQPRNARLSKWMVTKGMNVKCHPKPMICAEAAA